MIVTTFSPQGYEQYGKRFIETYKKYCNLPLVIYVEDDLKIEGVDVRNLYEVPNCIPFLQSVKNYKPDHYRRDVNKFSRKVFAITDAGLTHKGKFAFIGADTYFQKIIPNDFLDKLLGDKYIAYLGRSKLHSETDFIAFNTEDKFNPLFMGLFVSMYTTGAYKDLEYFCDSDVFDHIRKLLGVSETNLNTEDDHTHPFANSILDEYMIHLKGPERKHTGKYLEDDYKGMTGKEYVDKYRIRA